MHVIVSDATAHAGFTIFDKDTQKLLTTTAPELLTVQDGDCKMFPPILQNLCNRTLIFEIKLNDHNLKEGWQQFTVTKTFTPNAFLEEQHQPPNMVIKVSIITSFTNNTIYNINSMKTKSLIYFHISAGRPGKK